MSLLFSQDTAEQCDRCRGSHFTINKIVQITKDKREEHLVGYLMECVACNSKRRLEKDYFTADKR